MTEEMDSCEKIQSARAYLYLLYHKLYGGEPTEELMEALGGSDTSEALCIYAQEDETIEKCQGFLERLCRELADDERRQRFLGLCGDEYVAIFYGFPKALVVPSESFYRSGDHSLLSEVTLAVRDFYRRFNVLPARYPRTPDDHIALEMAFMSCLARDAMEAFDKRDWRELVTLLQAQAKFADDHLLAWIPSFAAEVRKMSDPCLYPQLIKTTEAFVSTDRQCLNNIALWLAEEVAPTDRDAPLGGTDGNAAVSSHEDGTGALDRLESLRLPHLEDNELVPTTA